MKKIAFLYFFISALIFSATVSGNVKVYTGENYGVFVYVKGADGYDVTDAAGDFKISGLQKGKEYKLIFQKDNFPDVVKTIKILENEENVSVMFKKNSAVIGESSSKSSVKTGSSKKKKSKEGNSEKTVKKYSEESYKSVNTREISGKSITSSSEPVFIKVKGKNYGTVIQPNSEFKFESSKDDIVVQIYQPGMKKREIIIGSGEKNVSMGEIKLEKERENSFDYKVSFNTKIEGVASLYKDAMEKYSVKIENSDTVTFKNVEPGNYIFKVISYGNDDYKTVLSLESGRSEKIELRPSAADKRIYVSLYPDNKEMSVKIYKNEDLIKSAENVKGLFIAENMEDGVEYKITAESNKYMLQEARAVKAGEKINIVLERDIKGAVVSGTIYPFGTDAEVMLLDGEKIIASGRTDENGNYELEAENIKSGRTIIRVRAEGFREAREIRTINAGKENSNINIALTPFAADIFGKVSINGQNDSSGVYVSIDELNVWQLTDAEGKFYFGDIKDGKYKISFRKYGYREIKKELVFTKNSVKEINTEMQPVGKIVINSNVDGYKININGTEESVEKKVYISEQNIGTVNITAMKDGYLNEKAKVEIKEAGEIKEVNITFRNSEEYKKYLEAKIVEIEELVDGMYVVQAEKKMDEFKLLEGADAYKADTDRLSRKLNQAKGNLFDDDRRILAEISRNRKEIEVLEKENVSYGEKRRKLSEKYRETLDFLEKILNENKYTTYKYEIYMFKSEIYEKSGMINSAKESKMIAMKYKDEQKKKR